MRNNYKYFRKFVDKIKRSRDYNDITYLYKLFENSITNPVELALVNSLLDKKYFLSKISTDKFCMFLKEIEGLDNNKEIVDLIDKIKSITEDTAQINTLDKILTSKGIFTDTYSVDHIDNIDNIDDINSTDNKPRVVNKIKKYCPHCGNPCIEDDNVDYVVCGYSIKGYDWKGCGFDWCFQCGKKLCKCWDLDELFNKLNRFHDRKCCKSHASKTYSKYPDDYCQCQNKYVCRENNHYQNIYKHKSAFV